jgi:hypothetical protein
VIEPDMRYQRRETAPAGQTAEFRARAPGGWSELADVNAFRQRITQRLDVVADLDPELWAKLEADVDLLAQQYQGNGQVHFAVAWLGDEDHYLVLAEPDTAAYWQGDPPQAVLWTYTSAS